MDRFPLLITLLVFSVVLFIQSCSTQSNAPLNLTSIDVEIDANSLRKVTTIEYIRSGEGLGDDGKQGTTDDDVFRYYVINERGYLNDISNKAKIVGFNSPGVDGRWFTNDDVEFYSKFLENDNLNAQFYADFNLDWLGGYGNRIYTKALSDLEIINYLYLGILPEMWNTGFGVNQIPRSRNFIENSFEHVGVNVYKILYQEEKELRINYNFLVFNQKQGIFNFSISDYSVKSIHSETKTQFMQYFISAGIDNIWFNQDDNYGAGLTTLKEEGSPVSKRIVSRYLDADINNVQFNDGDLFQYQEVSTFDLSGNLLTYDFINSGEDMLLDTEDDIFFDSYRQSHVYRESEHQVIRKHLVNVNTEEEAVSWSEIAIYDEEFEESKSSRLKMLGVLFPEQFYVLYNNLITSSVGSESITTYENRFFSKIGFALLANNIEISTIFDLVNPEDLTTSRNRIIKTIVLNEVTKKSTVELNLENGSVLKFTFLIGIRKK